MKTRRDRVLPVFYSDDYVSLVPNETKTLEIHSAIKDFAGQNAVIAVDGWNTTTVPEKSEGVTIEANREANPDLQPATGFAVQTVGSR